MTTQRRACDACHRRKIQCDRTDPEEQCNWCQHHNLPCTINRVRGRRKRPNKPSTDSLVKRLERVEESIAKARQLKQGIEATPKSPPASTPSSLGSGTIRKKILHGNCTACRSGSRPLSNELGATPLGQIWFSGQKFGAVCSRNGIPHFTSLGEQWIYSQTGQWPRFLDPSTSNISDDRRSPVGSNSLAGQSDSNQKLDLPDRWVVQTLLDTFVKSDFRLIFPVVDGVLFNDTIKDVYDDRQDTPIALEQISSKASIFAFVAFAAHYFSETEAARQIDVDACARQAIFLLPDFVEYASLTTLQTLIILFMYHSLCGHMQAAIMYHAVACRTVSALGGHVLIGDIPIDRAPTVEELHDFQIRLMFWLCYFFDKDIALRSGQPPIISDDYCDLTLPRDYLANKFSGHNPSQADKAVVPWLPGDLRLSLLKSKALGALYSACSLRKSDTELLRTIRELDEELENWRASIPAEYSPSLSIRKDAKLSPSLSEINTMLHIELHLDYHYLLNIIHTASERCVVDWSNSRKEKIFGLQSSLDLSVEASRATLVYLSETAPRLAGEAFWVFIFYPVSALMTIFFNILRNPQHEYAMHDLELLTSATSVIRSMPIERITANEIDYLQKMDVFIAELGRLCKAAIEKSQQLDDMSF